MESKNSSLSKYMDIFSKLSNYLIGIALLAYLGGFIIANIYLGYLGGLNFELVRVRYILVGILFFLFLGAIGYLIIGFFKTIRNYYSESTFRLLLRIIWYSFQNIAILYIAISAVGLLSGTLGPSIKGIPINSSEIQWDIWFQTVPISRLKGALIVGLFLTLVVFIIIGIFILINPKNKDGSRETRKALINNFWSAIKAKPFKLISITLLMIFFLFLWSTLSNLKDFLVTNSIIVEKSSTLNLPEGWNRFFGGVLIIYLLFAIYVFTIFTTNKESGSETTDLSIGNPLVKQSSLIYLIALAMVFILPLYSYGIYPYLPQQIGGGQLIKVNIVLADDSLSPYINSENEIYLVDRATNKAILLITNPLKSDYKLLEIHTDNFAGMIFPH